MFGENLNWFSAQAGSIDGIVLPSFPKGQIRINFIEY